jgi:5-methylcytosine-specific restriction endonuclease McrA
MAGNPIYGTKRWKEVRRLTLEEDPECHWCRLKGKRTKATQADHIVELDRGGDPYDRSNLVSSCASCNASRGARFVNQKTAQRIQNRNNATKTSFSVKTSTDRKSVV